MGSKDGKLWVLSDVINRVNGEGRAGINKAINKTEKQAQKQIQHKLGFSV